MDFSGLKKMCFRHAIIRFLSNCVAFLIEKIRSDSKGRCICMNEKFMKEKPVFPLIMSMATPMVISMLVNSLYNIVDSFLSPNNRRGRNNRSVACLSGAKPRQCACNRLRRGT